MPVDYESARRDFRWERPEHFNFATDVIDRHAAERPQAPALQWSDESGQLAALHLPGAEGALAARGALPPGPGAAAGRPRLHPDAARAGVVVPGAGLHPRRHRLHARHAHAHRQGHPLPAGGVGREAPSSPTPSCLDRFEGVAGTARRDDVGLHRRGARAVDRATTPGAWHGRPGRRLPAHARGRPAAHLLHVRHHRHAEDGAPHPRQLRPSGTRITGRYWLDLTPDDLHLTLSRHRLGQVRLGQALRSVEPGRVHRRLRLPRPLRRRGLPEAAASASGVTTLLRAAHRVARARARGPGQWSLPGAAPRASSAGEPLNPEVIEAWKRGHRADHPRGLRADGDRGHRAACSRACRSAPGLDGQALPGLRRGRHRRRRRARSRPGRRGTSPCA